MNNTGFKEQVGEENKKENEKQTKKVEDAATLKEK